ncbi:MAG: AI-2E family transporter [Gemmatimonadota bacterium]|nr:AI-2E family transporter [Gemmatimonadota bacterium]
MTDPTKDPSRDLHPGEASEHRNATEPAHRGTVPPGDVGRGAVRHNRSVGWRSRDIVRTAALVLGMYLLVQLIWYANALFLLIFLGILFAIAISAGVDRLQRLGVPRGMGAALIVIVFFGLLTGFGAWMAPVLRAQGAELRVKMPQAIDRVEEWLNRRQSGMLGVLFGGALAPAGGADTAAPAAGAAPTAPAAAPAATPRAPATQGDSAKPAPQTRTDSTAAPANHGLRGMLQQQLGGASRYLFGFLSHTVAAVGGIVLVVFLSIYLAADPELYRRGALALLPTRRRRQASLVMDRIATVLRKWLVTQLIAMAVIGTVTTIALLVLRVKAAFALGLLAGLFEFIPTVGPILSAVPSVAMGFLDSPEKAFLVMAVYIGIQFLENHLLIPLLMKGGMDLPPALTVLAQALLAIVFGFLGLMVAVPLLATVLVVTQALYVEHLPTQGTWTHRVVTGGGDHDLDESLEDELAADG